MGFGWDDVNIYKFGVQWQYQPDLASGRDTVMPPMYSRGQALFNIWPSGCQSATFRLVSAKLEGGSEINLAFTYMPEERCMGQTKHWWYHRTDRPCVYGSMGAGDRLGHRFLIMH